MADYKKQSAIFDQAVLRNSSIAISGASDITDFMLLYIAGLGIGNVLLFNQGKGGFLKKDYSLVSRINPDVKIEVVNSGFEPAFVGKINAIGDFSSDIRQKKAALDYSARCNAKLYISAPSLESFYNPSRLSSLLWNPSVENSPLPFSSGMMAAIALDEIRKALLPLPGDELTSGKLYSAESIPNPSIIDKIRHNTAPSKRALVIGAGGIGTYVALNLALLGIPMEIYDGDTVEETNLNRQVFYYDSIGKNKAKSLKEKLESLVNANITANSCFFGEKHFKKADYSAVFSCVDSWPARKTINAYALKNNIPLIDAGVGPFTARLDICNKNTCLECRRGRVNEVPSPGGCALLQESNVVMCNAFIGAMAVASFYAMQSGKSKNEKQLLYFSKRSLNEKISMLNIERQCSSECKCSCHGR